MTRLITILLAVLVSGCFAQMQLDSAERVNLLRLIMNKDSIISVQQTMELRKYLDEAEARNSASLAENEELHKQYLMLNERIIAKDRISAPIVTAEVLGQNLLVWAWDRYVIQKDYARINPDYWKRNLREGWDWDHNHWAINFYGHPYQGSMYYAAARSAGYGFYRSLLWAGLGSFTWEYFAETEYPAPNDLVSTAIGGSMYGEVLYRLSRLFYNNSEAPWYKQLAAFILEPAGFLQRKAFGNRDHLIGWVPIEFTLALGGGSRFGSDYRFGSHAADELDKEWNDHFSLVKGHLEYGKPYTIVKQPFDYFTMDAVWEAGNEGAVLQLDVMGKLKNAGIHGNGHWLDFSLNLDYDSFYGDLATVSTISIGGAMDLALWLTPSLRFRVMNQVYWIILGTTDMGYDDLIKEIHPEYESDMDNYQYNTGAKYSLLVELSYKQKFRFSNKLVVDAMRTIPYSLPHYGARGWDFLVLNNTALEYSILSWLQIGSQLDTYLKMAAYSNGLFEPMSRRIFNYGLYVNFRIF